MAALFASLLLATSVGMVLSSCPHTTHGLKRWSHATSWPGNKKPGVNGKVVISEGVLLDESPPELDSITIEATGRLVWSPEGDYNVTTNFILVKGRMDIGSEDCKYTRKTTITLTGIRGRYKVMLGPHLFGEKFIGVAPGGTLELHGKDKHPWTKLTKTLPKLTKDTGLMYDHETSGRNTLRWKDGLNAYIFDSDGKFVKYRTYYLGEYEKYHYQSDPTDLASLLQSVKFGEILMLAVQNNLIEARVDLTPVYEALETFTDGHVTGSGLIRSVKAGDAYAMIMQKGKPETLDEHIGVNHHLESQRTSASLTLWDKHIKFSVSSYVHNQHEYLNRVNFRVITLFGAYPVLDLIDDVTSWEEGDKLVLPSTDYLWGQTEVATVINCTFCKHNQIRVDLEAAYMHYGEMLDQVDERGEVGLLTRNILIQGRMEKTCPPSNDNCHAYNYDTFGGHMKFVRGYKNVHIEGVELKHMGQQSEVGFYPIHFHMCHDIDSVGGYSDPAWVRLNSIHHTYSRCVTVHGSHGATVADNVAYDHLGHCFFLEDGGEKRTVFDGNLGVATKKGSILPSDKKNPATFWITSPLAYVRNNVAAGGMGIGFWYVFPDEPQGPSYGLGFFKKDEARHTPLSEFNNNVAHSYTHFGLFMDSKIFSNLDTGDDNQYDPREVPLNTSSPQKEVYFYRFTGYKNRYQNGWIRGGLILVDRSSFADSARGMTFAKYTPSQTLINSVIIGESRNIGEPTSHHGVSMPRSVPNVVDMSQPYVGFMLYDGPSHLKNVWFSGFRENVNYTMGAIGFLRDDYYTVDPTNTVYNLKFDFEDGHATGNRVYDGNQSVHDFHNNDGDKTSAFRDLDGSVTGYPGSSVVKPGPYYHNARCYRRDNWNMEICPQKFGLLNFRLMSAADHHKSHPFIIRDDQPGVKVTETWGSNAGFSVALGGEHSYTVHWSGRVPREFEVKGEGVEKGDWLRFGICFPRDAKVSVQEWYPTYRDNANTHDKYHWKMLTSVQELDQDTTGGSMYHDKNTGLMFFKYINFHERLENETDSCPERCPILKFKVESGDMSDGDCSSRAYGPYKRAPIAAKNALRSNHLPATANFSPTGWGAGSTKPFETRVPINGHYGVWTNWSQCSNSCGGGTQTRIRSCDVSGNVEDCHRPLVEYRHCNGNSCP